MKKSFTKAIVLVLLSGLLVQSKANDLYPALKKPATESLPLKIKKYLYGDFELKYFPTEVNVYYGYALSTLKYESLNDYRSLYKTLYGGDLPQFKNTWSTMYGLGFRILAVGLELGTTKILYSSSVNENVKGMKGTRQIDLNLSENSLAFFIGKRTKLSSMGINVGGVFGNASLTPVFRDEQGNIGAGGINYLIGTYTAKYSYVTAGLEYGIGYGRIKLVARYDWSIRPLFKDNLFPYGLAIRDDKQMFEPGPNYGPYIPRDIEAFNDTNAKFGAGNGHNYVGSDIRCQRFSIRLVYSIIYRQMPMSKKS